MIRTRSLGRVGLAVTELAFGASGIGNLGYAQSDDDAAATPLSEELWRSLG